MEDERESENLSRKIHTLNYILQQLFYTTITLHNGRTHGIRLHVRENTHIYMTRKRIQLKMEKCY